MHRTTLKMKTEPNIGVKLIRDQQANLNKLNCPNPEQLFELGNKTPQKSSWGTKINDNNLLKMGHDRFKNQDIAWFQPPWTSTADI